MAQLYDEIGESLFGRDFADGDALRRASQMAICAKVSNTVAERYVRGRDGQV